jgi:hypothetical protein
MADETRKPTAAQLRVLERMEAYGRAPDLELLHRLQSEDGAQTANYRGRRRFCVAGRCAYGRDDVTALTNWGNAVRRAMRGAA